VFVHAVERQHVEGWVRVSYRLDWADTARPPLHVYFEVPEEWASLLHTGPEPGLMAALFPALAGREVLRTDVPVSSRFAYGLKQFAAYFSLHFPGVLQFSGLEAPRAVASAPPRQSTGVFFSGGVDSFYTVFCHRPEREPDPRYHPHHAIFVQGMDLTLDQKLFYERIGRRYQPVVESLGMQLIRVRTNVKTLLDHSFHWLYSHGAALLSIAHLLSGGLGRIFIASTNRFSVVQPPIGSNPITDPWPSSERLEILHHGCEASRLVKVNAIAGWPPAMENLRVCWQRHDQELNCGVCPKCQRTQLMLWAANKVPACTTFPPNFDPLAVKADLFAPRTAERDVPELSFAEEWLQNVRVTHPESFRRATRLTRQRRWPWR
jgi:hypothetical protein